MEVKKSLNVAVPVSEVSEACQSGSVDLISEAEFPNVSMYIFSSEKFFGHKVTVGVRVDRSSDDVVRIYFKAALCSPLDRFNKATGEEITLGRLVKADSEEPNMAIFVKKLNNQEIADTLNANIQSLLKSYAELLMHKDQSDKLMDMAESVRRNTLKRSFKRYK